MGRVVALVVMVVGVGTFAALTAGIAAYFVESEASDEQTRQVAAMHQEVVALRQELRSALSRLEDRGN
jgi:hypothetical protein